MNETVLRIISGIAIALVYTFFFSFGGFAFLPLFLFIGAVNLIVLNEFSSMFLNREENRFIRFATFMFSTALLACIYLDSVLAFGAHGGSVPDLIQHAATWVPKTGYPVAFISVMFIITTGAYCIVKSRLQGAVEAIAYSLFGMIYITFTISFIFKLRSLPNGVYYISLVSLITVMTDVWGYFIGKFLGRHKVNLPVSPKKTWEGYIGSLVMQIGFVFLFFYLTGRFFTVPVFSAAEIFFISILIFFTSVFGDLFESLLKRNASIKDSGSILPGHGGLLDRIDSIMFSLPVFYYYLKFFR